MTIWLADKSIEDLVKIPLNVNQRLLVNPNNDNEVYVWRNWNIHYRLSSDKERVMLGMRKGSNIRYEVFMEDVRGCVAPTQHVFRDKNGKTQELSYLDVKVWDQIPEGYRDVILFHEIIEGIYMDKGLKSPEPHNLSVTETIEYILKHLSPREKETYSDLISTLKFRE